MTSHVVSFTLRDQREHKPKPWWKRHWLECVLSAIGIVCLNLVFLADAFNGSGRLNPQSAGLLGDFVGGYVGAYFALLSAVLLFATLNNQRRDTHVQSFEARYFELIRLHRENVAELRLGKASGRAVFVRLVRELRLILPVVRELAAQCKLTLNQLEALHISYYCLFFGTGPNSSRMLRTHLPDFDQAFVEALEARLNDRSFKLKSRKDRHLGYMPFEGHQSRLGHYYRHLYQAVKWLDLQALDIDKYDMAKMLRAQLSTHEQALLLINSFTPLGRPWWTRNFIQHYNVVMNISEDFFDPATELDLSNHFPAGYFEWEQSTNV